LPGRDGKADPDWIIIEIADQNGTVRHSAKVRLGQTVTLQLIPVSGGTGATRIKSTVR